MNKDKTIKFLGVIFITVGLLQLILGAKDIWWHLVFIFRSSAYPSVHGYLFYSAVSLFFFIILPLAIGISGIGIFRIRRWGWILAIMVCTITFIVKFIGTIYYAFAVYKSEGNPMPTISEGAQVAGFVSMWPTYIYAVTSALLILLLTQSSTKKAFNNK
jgi:hypothetical protein